MSHYPNPRWSNIPVQVHEEETSGDAPIGERSLPYILNGAQRGEALWETGSLGGARTQAKQIHGRV